MSPAPEVQPGESPRPRQVTLAGWLVIAASLMLVVSVFEQLADLRSLETRTAIEQFLGEPPGSQLGLGRESVLTLIRTVSMVAAGLATAAGILGWHVLKRNRAARVALTVLAVPLFLCGLVTGGFLASVVLASVAMLWLAPSRYWFAGTTPPPAAVPPAAHADAPPLPPPMPPPSSGPPSDQQPPPWTPYSTPAPWGAPATDHPSARLAQARTPRPTPVAVACAITWFCCGLTAILSVALVAALVTDADGLFAEMQRRNPDLGDQGVSGAMLESVTWTIAIGCLLWSSVSGVLAVLAFNRMRWAGLALVVSAGTVALLCLAGSVVSPPLAVPGVLAAVTAVLLLQPTSQHWLARRETRRPDGMM